MDANTKIDGRRLRIIAVHADGTDAVTVSRYLRGLPVRPSSAARIERALRELGLEALIRAGHAGPLGVLDALPVVVPMAASSAAAAGGGSPLAAAHLLRGRFR